MEPIVILVYCIVIVYKAFNLNLNPSKLFVNFARYSFINVMCIMFTFLIIHTRHIHIIYSFTYVCYTFYIYILHLHRLRPFSIQLHELTLIFTLSILLSGLLVYTHAISLQSIVAISLQCAK